MSGKLLTDNLFFICDKTRRAWNHFNSRVIHL